MQLPFASMALAAGLLLPIADRPPTLDVEPSCRGGMSSGLTIRRDIDACMKGERAARDQLAKNWNTFSSADKIRCVEMTQMGGPPSYVEVLTCVEMADQARKIPDHADVNTGTARRR